MVKKGSVAIIVFAVLFGGVGIYIKTHIPREEKSKEASTIKPTQSVTQTEKASESIEQNVTPTTANSPGVEKGPYPMEINIKKTYEAVLTTSFGDITIRLNVSTTPVTVNNFIALSRKNFYNNTVFHRIIKGFMIQGGDPKGNGSGGPGYTFADEPFVGEYTRGAVAMANAGPNTNGSQFFIMHKDYPLPKNYVIFGSVINGMDVVDKIAEAPTEVGGEGSKPVTPTTITSVQIIER
jgi:cyclophilin family peptidyl-prolyl cis-trans isomerase